MKRKRENRFRIRPRWAPFERDAAHGRLNRMEIRPERQPYRRAKERKRQRAGQRFDRHRHDVRIRHRSDRQARDEIRRSGRNRHEVRIRFQTAPREDRDGERRPRRVKRRRRRGLDHGIRFALKVGQKHGSRRAVNGIRVFRRTSRIDEEDMNVNGRDFGNRRIRRVLKPREDDRRRRVRLRGGIRRLLTRDARRKPGMTEKALRVRRQRQRGLDGNRDATARLEKRPILVRRARQAGGGRGGRGRRKDRHGNDGVRPQRERGGDDVTRRRAQNVLVRLAGPRGFVDGNGRQPRPRRDCGIRPRREPH